MGLALGVYQMRVGIPFMSGVSFFGKLVSVIVRECGGGA
jgi:hypothetical protein